MIEVFDRQVFDQYMNPNSICFFGSSIYGVANELFGRGYYLIGIKNNDQTRPFLLIKESIKNSKYFHFMLYDPNTLSLSKVLEKNEQKGLNTFLKKNKCLYLTLLSDGSQSRNIKQVFYHLELDEEFLENLDLEVQSKINNSYKFPLNLINLDTTNMEYFVKLFPDIDKKKLMRHLKAKGIHYKLVALNIAEYIDNLMKQRNELLLKRTEEKLQEVKSDDGTILEIERKITKAEKTIETLKQLQEVKGDILYLSAGIFLEYKDSLVEYKTAEEPILPELNARYYMSFKMVKYGVENYLKHYYDMNRDNILHLEQKTLYESKENIIKKISYKLYKRKDKNHDGKINS